MKFFTVNCQFS